MSITKTALDYKTDFQTPLQVAKYMCDMVPPGTKTILEPTPGLGNIVRFLSGYRVTAPDDYFLLPKSRYDCVVMNPPFSAKFAVLDNCQGDYTKHGMRLGYMILKECMGMSDNVIALMPWFTISDSDVRLRYLKSYGLRSVTALPRKTFQYARIQTVVLELDRKFHGTTAFKVFELKDEDQKLKLEL
jgi:type I restriction-modification system DNA methylase subunit